MVFKNLCVLVLWTKVAISALEGLKDGGLILLLIPMTTENQLVTFTLPHQQNAAPLSKEGN